MNVNIIDVIFEGHYHHGFSASPLGFLLTALGLSLLINRMRIKEIFDSTLSNPGIQFIAGILPIMVGSISLSLAHIEFYATNNSYTCLVLGIVSYTLITIGFIRLLFPSLWLKQVEKMMNSRLMLTIVPVIMLLLGLFFLSHLFLHDPTI